MYSYGSLNSNPVFNKTVPCRPGKPFVWYLGIYVNYSGIGTAMCIAAACNRGFYVYFTVNVIPHILFIKTDFYKSVSKIIFFPVLGFYDIDWCSRCIIETAVYKFLKPVLFSFYIKLVSIVAFCYMYKRTVMASEISVIVRIVLIKKFIYESNCLVFVYRLVYAFRTFHIGIYSCYEFTARIHKLCPFTFGNSLALFAKDISHKSPLR